MYLYICIFPYLCICIFVYLYSCVLHEMHARQFHLGASWRLRRPSPPNFSPKLKLNACRILEDGNRFHLYLHQIFKYFHQIFKYFHQIFKYFHPNSNWMRVVYWRMATASISICITTMCSANKTWSQKANILRIATNLGNWFRLFTSCNILTDITSLHWWWSWK